MDVGQRERGVQLIPRDVVEQPDVGQALAIPGGTDLHGPRAPADEQEDDVVAVAEPAGRLEELVERMGQAEVARVHRDELAIQTERLAQRVGLALDRVDLVAAAPDRDRHDPLLANALDSTRSAMYGPSTTTRSAWR